MNNTYRENQTDLPDALLEDAAIWEARLRDGDRAGVAQKQVLTADFNAWLAADARHRQAFEEMRNLWGALEVPVAEALSELPLSSDPARQGVPPSSRADRPEVRPRRRPYLYPRLAIAASLLLAMLLGIGWQQDWPTQWQSDYVTPVGEQAAIDMDDGSRITLNTHSALAKGYTAEQRRVRLLRGEAWFDVSPGDGRPFIVETAQGDIRVTGTRFNVRLDANEATVSLDEGGVILRLAGSPDVAPVRLAPGQQAILADRISAPVLFDRIAVSAWTRGQFVFYETPLSEVVKNLNRYRQGRIIVTGGELANLKVSGIFSTSDTDAALAVITSILPVQQTRFTDYLVVLR